MGNKKGFESFNESTNVSEIFDFPESRNQSQLLNENFVFNFEENGAQTGFDYNDPYLGLEDNPNEEERKVEQELSRDDKKDLQNNADGTANAQASEVTSSSSASSSAAASSTSGVAASSSDAAGASGVIATVAATATAAVVLVVGGGMAIYGQGLDQPTICEFDKITAVENNINFTLAVGNNREKINSGEEKDECDIYVELKCPSIEDFEQRVSVPAYGITESSFTDLKYDTEYVVTVYQNMMMLDNADALTSPISIWTKKKEVGPEPGPEPEPVGESHISVYKEIEPLDNYRYMMEVVTETIPQYASYEVGFALPSESSNSDGGDSWLITIPYDVEKMGKQVMTDITDSELTASEYKVDFIGVDESGIKTVIFTNNIAVEDISQIDYDTNETNLFLRYDDIVGYSGKEYYYYCFFNYNEDIHGSLSGEIMVSARGLTEEEPFMVDYISSPNEEYPLSNWDLGDQHSYRGRYEVTVTLVSSDTQQETILWQEEVRFGYLPNKKYSAPNINSVNFLVGESAYSPSGQLTTYGLYVDIEYEDEYGVWADHDFRINLFNSDRSIDKTSTVVGYSTLATRYYLQDISASEITQTLYTEDLNWRMCYGDSTDYIKASSQPINIQSLDTFTIDGSVNFYNEVQPTGGTILKYNMAFSSVFSDFDEIYMEFSGTSSGAEFTFSEYVTEVNKAIDFSDCDSRLLQSSDATVKTFGVISGSDNLIFEETVDFTNLPQYRPPEVSGVTFSIGSYPNVKDYLFVTLNVSDPAHSWSKPFEIVLSTTSTPTYTFSSEVEAYYLSGHTYLPDIDVATIFETQSEEYTITVRNDGETVYESVDPLKYEDLTTANITGSVETRFEPEQGTDIEKLEFLCTDDGQELSNAYSISVRFKNVDDSSDTFESENLVVNNWNSIDKAREELSDISYYVETYVAYSEGDTPILIAKEVILFS